METGTTYECNKLYNISLTELEPDPNQPRKHLDNDSLKELTSSIAEHGIIEPILFRRENGQNYIVVGERRCEAARQAGREKVPAIFIDSRDHEEISLVENMIRSDLTFIEEAEAMKRLMQKRQYTQENMSRKLGKSRVNITETLILNRLPQEIRDECRNDPTVPKRVLIDIARKKNEKSMLKAYQRYKEQLTAENKKHDKKTTKAERAVNAIFSAENTIIKLDMEMLTSEEKYNICIAADALKTILDAFITDSTSDQTEMKEQLLTAAEK